MPDEQIADERDASFDLNEFCKAIPAPTIANDARKELGRILTAVRLPAPISAAANRAQVFTPTRVQFYIDTCLDALHDLHVERSDHHQYHRTVIQRMDSFRTHALNFRHAIAELLLDNLKDQMGPALCTDDLLMLNRMTRDAVIAVNAAREQLPVVPRGPKGDGPRSRFVDRLVIEFIDQFGFLPAPSASGKFTEFVSTFLERTGEPKHNCARLVRKSVTGIGRAYASAST